MARLPLLFFVCMALITSITCFTGTEYVPLPPSTDAFYQAPAGFETTQPGTILRWRNVEAVPVYVNTSSLAATYQILFRSTDSQGNPNAVVTTLFVPIDPQPDKLLSFQVAYDSASVDCSTSYQLYQNTSLIVEASASVFSLALEEGWYVSSPDYESFNAAFTNGIQSGQAVLDSIRALLASSNFTGLSKDAKYAVAGGSGGALASEWALELQSSYAPELSLAGALLTALTPNISSVFQTINGGQDAGLAVSSLLGLSKQYANFSAWLSANLLPQYALFFFEAASACLEQGQVIYNNTDLSPFFDVPLLYADIPVSIIENTGIMGLHGIPKAPIASFKGTADEISVVADTDALMAQYCAEGVEIQYYRFINASHSEAGGYGFVAGWPWLVERLNGIPAPAGCQTYNLIIPT
jgi:hypothetical protein